MGRARRRHRGARLQSIGWRRKRRSTPAPNAAAPAPSGWASARTAAPGTRWSRRWPRARGKPRYAAGRGLLPVEAVSTLAEIEATDVDRQPTGIDELDRVLGGGIVAGGVVLIGGDPGIGKSTLLLQALDALSRDGEGRSTSPARRAAPRSRCARAGSASTAAGARAGRDPAREDPRHARRRSSRRWR